MDKRPEIVFSSDLLIYIPAYNCSNHIISVLDEIPASIWAIAEILIVDNHSTDDTVARVEAIPGAHLLRHAQNTHIAGALLDGFRFASERGYEHCITMDAGLSHDPDEIPRFHALREADLVIGARTERIDAPWYRHALSWGASTLTNLALKRRLVPWGDRVLRWP